mmetsp:Transcript_9936/g.16636  ORF Transcript_9936/g.16636 Transcript_9936/m.16636 type:complete len:255 (+) Transcript_9936:381-1145(+)
MEIGMEWWWALEEGATGNGDGCCGVSTKFTIVMKDDELSGHRPDRNTELSITIITTNTIATQINHEQTVRIGKVDRQCNGRGLIHHGVIARHDTVDFFVVLIEESPSKFLGIGVHLAVESNINGDGCHWWLCIGWRRRGWRIENGGRWEPKCRKCRKCRKAQCWIGCESCCRKGCRSYRWCNGCRGGEFAWQYIVDRNREFELCRCRELSIALCQNKIIRGLGSKVDIDIAVSITAANTISGRIHDFEYIGDCF